MVDVLKKSDLDKMRFSKDSDIKIVKSLEDK